MKLLCVTACFAWSGRAKAEAEAEARNKLKQCSWHTLRPRAVMLGTRSVVSRSRLLFVVLLISLLLDTRFTLVRQTRRWPLPTRKGTPWGVTEYGKHGSSGSRRHKRKQLSPQCQNAHECPVYHTCETGNRYFNTWSAANVIRAVDAPSTGVPGTTATDAGAEAGQYTNVQQHHGVSCCSGNYATTRSLRVCHIGKAYTRPVQSTLQFSPWWTHLVRHTRTFFVHSRQ